MAQVRKELTYACREDKMCLIDKRQRNRFLSSSSSSLSEIVSLMMVLARSNTFIAINHLCHIHHHHHVGAGQMPVLPLPKVFTMWDEEGGSAGGEAARQQVGITITIVMMIRVIRMIIVIIMMVIMSFAGSVLMFHKFLISRGQNGEEEVESTSLGPGDMPTGKDIT